MKWIDRKTVTYKLEDLPFEFAGKLDVINPSKIKVLIPGYVYPVDVGSLCYTKTKRAFHDTTNNKCSIVLVRIDSFRKLRTEFIRKYLDFLNRCQRNGKSAVSIHGYHGQVSYFVRWCDKNMPAGIDDENLIKKAYLEFSNYLLHKVKLNQININTAAHSQLAIKTTIKSIFNDKFGSALEGVRNIRRSQEATKITEPPTDEEASVALKAYSDIFNQLTSFIVNFEQFPMKLELSHNSYWYFPNEIPFISHTRLTDANKTRPNYYAYNYTEGRLNSEAEIIQKVKVLGKYNQLRQARHSLKSAQLKIQSANVNQYHHRRVLGATLAAQSFVMLFSANTAMGLGQIAAIEWHGTEFDVVNERLGFKTIKPRAGNKQVSFLVTSDFLEVLKKYLKLREYLLQAHQGQSCRHLFFRIVNGKIRPLGMDICTHFNERLKRLFDMDIKITTRQWRAYKSNWLLNNTDLVTTSMVLQNTNQTVLKHYTAGSESRSALELTSYFEHFNKNLIIDATESSVPISVGQCISVDKPSPISEILTLKPDCKKPEGCIFCKQYAVHADEVDIRKLLSYKYVIEQTRILASSEEHYEELFKPVLTRIEEVLNKISLSNHIQKEAHDRILHEVYIHEMLDPFWLRKLNMLVDLEAI